MNIARKGQEKNFPIRRVQINQCSTDHSSCEMVQIQKSLHSSPILPVDFLIGEP